MTDCLKNFKFIACEAEEILRVPTDKQTEEQCLSAPPTLHKGLASELLPARRVQVTGGQDSLVYPGGAGRLLKILGWSGLSVSPVQT